MEEYKKIRIYNQSLLIEGFRKFEVRDINLVMDKENSILIVLWDNDKVIKFADSKFILLDNPDCLGYGNEGVELTKEEIEELKECVQDFTMDTYYNVLALGVLCDNLELSEIFERNFNTLRNE